MLKMKKPCDPKLPPEGYIRLAGKVNVDTNTHVLFRLLPRPRPAPRLATVDGKRVDG